jgi:alpha-glucosidase (family GH31 glycosyl hydrolase)
MEEVVGNYSSFDLPLDNFLSDISYMDRYRDFTYDDVNFKGLPDFVSNLTTKNM